MWLFALLFFVNAVAPHHSFVYNEAYRLNIAGLPVNILDGLIFVGAVLSVLPFWTRSAAPVSRPNPAWVRGLTFLLAAFALGVLQSYVFFPDLPPRFRLPVIRNFALTPVCLYIGYRCFTQAYQAGAFFWIVFVSSIGSAVASILTQSQATSHLGETSRATASLDMLRKTALDVSGDAGLLAACVILFALASGAPLLGTFRRWIVIVVCSVGMLLIPHRSSWLLDVIAMTFAGFFMWPYNVGRKIVTNVLTCIGLFIAGAILLSIVQSQTNRDLGGWLQERVASLLPSSEGSNRARAWDTRVPGMLYELRLAVWNPILGRGFGAPEDKAIRDAEYHSFRHTPWITTLCETGVVGVAGFGFVIVGLWVVGTRLARQSTDRSFVLLGAIGASWGIVCFFAGFMTLHWNSPRQAITLGLLAGLIFRARDLSLTMAQTQQLPLTGYAARSYEAGYA